MTDSILLTKAQIDTYQNDGAIVLRDVFNKDELVILEECVENALLNPGAYARNFSREVKNDSEFRGDFFGDLFASARDPKLKKILISCPLGEISGRLMDSSETRFFFDHLLVKEPGGFNPTPWHQDAPYFPIEGLQCCGIWIALDQVTLDNGAVEYILGSHKTEFLYKQKTFSGSNKVFNALLRDIPDIDNKRNNYNIVSWELNPGDCVVHHVRMLHGAPANNTKTDRRRGIATRWIGDDIIYGTRPGIPDDLRNYLNDLAPSLIKGYSFDNSLFPVVWKRPD